MTRLHLTIRRKLFSHDDVEPLGTMPATATKTPRGFIIALGAFRGVKLPSDTQPIIRRHVAEFLKDKRFSFFWNEDSGFETEVKLV